MINDPTNPSTYGFKPKKLTVPKGTKVTWVNTTSAPHTVMSDDGKFKSSDPSAPIVKGQMYSFTFNTAGKFTYKCGIHPPQVGEIDVQ